VITVYLIGVIRLLSQECGSEPRSVHASHDCLGIKLRLNGKTMQNSNTNQMIFRVEQIVSYISQVFTVEPGDLIFTGTPPGVGMAHKPEPVWLKAGDVAEVEIEGIGILRNPVVGE
jgi:2-keto-4-pentenoate hydratase/2-oxohepta-3-ene-1,7-dioic acid hydratase in catechol pathway